MVHSPPYCLTDKVIFQYTQIGDEIRYPLDTFIFIIMLSKIYLIMRVLMHFSMFNFKYTDRFIGKKETVGTDITYGFIVKSLLRQRPYTMLALFFFIVSFWFAFAVRLFERPYYDDPEVGNSDSDSGDYQDYSLFNNAWWLVVVTMTTVGYGDYFPKTHIGRIVVILACFTGVFLVSLTVVTLTSESEFTNGEKEVYRILHRLKKRKNIIIYAKKVIYYNAIYYNLKRKIIKDRLNPDAWTYLRTIREAKKIHQAAFSNKRKILLNSESEKIEKINFNFSTVQQKLSIAMKLEDSLKG
jgi:hypothetical protein